ncbi:hypothetical protein BJY14_000513 [Actinomadura luteofluorescens]|uniref:Uncharacterized protein n=1 Tax=Actinomadura luteofluorescens TaxID=46163 RepID=A0A7Y9JD47_9ACTN|nr:hypothetical protein [Actinomadura luteofluorescens]
MELAAGLDETGAVPRDVQQRELVLVAAVEELGDLMAHVVGGEIGHWPDRRERSDAAVLEDLLELPEIRTNGRERSEPPVVIPLIADQQRFASLRSAHSGRFPPSILSRNSPMIRSCA